MNVSYLRDFSQINKPTHSSADSILDYFCS